MRLTVTVRVLPLLCALGCVLPATSQPNTLEAERAREEYAYALGVQAYIWGFPLVEMERTKRMMVGNPSPDKPLAQINHFFHASKLVTYATRITVIPNNDTLYSSSWLDLSDEPLILHVPDTHDRYYVMAFYDAYTNNFANVGKRTTGTKAADFLITGPNWKGPSPEGLMRIAAPTNMVWLLGRTIVSGPSDIPNVQAIQRQYSLTRLAARPTASDNPEPLMPTGPPFPKPDKMPGLQFFQILGETLVRNPPPSSEQALVSQYEKIGISRTTGFDPTRLDPATAAGLARAIPAARAIIKQNGASFAKPVNGWQMLLQGGIFGDDFLFRAVIADRLLAQLVPEEAIYPLADFDAEGRKLSGSYRYVLHFDKDQLPPAKEFWSLTMYGADYFLVENLANRYSIGDRTEGLRYNTDGSLDIYLQHERPAGKESNWLPAPSGDFTVCLRLYGAKSEVLHGDYKIPGIRNLTK
jgi:hypothetical protein